jgi:hypothetical protein
MSVSETLRRIPTVKDPSALMIEFRSRHAISKGFDFDKKVRFAFGSRELKQIRR